MKIIRILIFQTEKPWKYFVTNVFEICLYRILFFLLAENRADALIQDLISSTRVSKSPQEILKEMEAERKEMEEQFTIRAGEADKLREQEVLSKYILEFLQFFNVLSSCISSISQNATWICCCILPK